VRSGAEGTERVSGGEHAGGAGLGGKRELPGRAGRQGRRCTERERGSGGGGQGPGGPAGVREWGGRAWGVCVCELQGGCWVGTGGQGEGAER
jgi:hypothetical protein